MNSTLPESVQNVAKTLAQHGLDSEIVMLSDAARTAQQAAQALGCSVAQIAKSLIFRHPEREQAVLVIANGSQRVNEERINAALQTRIGKADAAFVREQTGYAIGGVPPLAHRTAPLTLLDKSLLEFDKVWAAAGHPHAVFAIAPQKLLELTGASLIDAQSC